MIKIYNQKIQKKKRQYLRNNATQAERLLWNYIKNNQAGYKFRRQHGIDNYIVDFYCPQLRLIIELDGEAHDYHRQINLDYKKEEKLKKYKLKIIRYNNFDVICNTMEVFEDIKNKCDILYKKIKNSSPPQVRRGQGW